MIKTFGLQGANIPFAPLLGIIPVHICSILDDNL